MQQLLADELYAARLYVAVHQGQLLMCWTLLCCLPAVAVIIFILFFELVAACVLFIGQRNKQADRHIHRHLNERP